MEMSLKDFAKKYPNGNVPDEVAEEIEQKDFPSVIEQAKNLTKLVTNTVIAAASGNDVFVSIEIKNERLLICNECPHYFKEEFRSRCKECGCFLEQKTQFSEAECPIGKW
jgi:hypothetical protein